MSLKRNRDEISKTPADQDIDADEIFESSSIEDRNSTFVAAFSPTVAPKSLQAYPPYKKASHRILAWRTPSKQQSLKVASGSVPPKVLHDVGSDDDDEKYAGKKLEKLLIEMDVTGSVVVARWYGGILLGPVRFDHIVNVAQEAIKKWQSAAADGLSSKRTKIDTPPNLTPEQEADKIKRLSKQLVDRDNSIKVLRDLLAEKKATKEADSGALSNTTSSQDVPKSTAAGPDYQSMPLTKLRQLEKARDTTISWILKQIDQIETAEKKTTTS